MCNSATFWSLNPHLDYIGLYLAVAFGTGVKGY